MSPCENNGTCFNVILTDLFSLPYRCACIQGKAQETITEIKKNNDIFILYVYIIYHMKEIFEFFSFLQLLHFGFNALLHIVMYIFICLLGGKLGLHYHWILVWVSSIMGQNIHCLAPTPSPTSTYTWYPLHTSQKERVIARTWRSMIRLTPGGWSSLALVGCPPKRGCWIIDPRVGKAHQPWLETHIVDGNSDF